MESVPLHRLTVLYFQNSLSCLGARFTSGFGHGYVTTRDIGHFRVRPILPLIYGDQAKGTDVECSRSACDSLCYLFKVEKAAFRR